MKTDKEIIEALNKAVVEILEYQKAQEEKTPVSQYFKDNKQLGTDIIKLLTEFRCCIGSPDYYIWRYCGGKGVILTKRMREELEKLREKNKTSDDKDYAQYELDVACGYDMALEDITSFLDGYEKVTGIGI